MPCLADVVSCRAGWGLTAPFHLSPACSVLKGTERQGRARERCKLGVTTCLLHLGSIPKSIK